MPKFKTLKDVQRPQLSQIIAQTAMINRSKKVPSSLDRVASSLTLNNKKIKWSYLSKVGQVMRYGYPVQD